MSSNPSGSDENMPRNLAYQSNLIMTFYKSSTCRNQILSSRYDFTGNRLTGDTALTACDLTNFGYIDNYRVEKYFEDKFIVVWDQSTANRDTAIDIYFMVYNTIYGSIKGITQATLIGLNFYFSL